MLAALEADLDALERMQTSAENCDPGNGWAGVMKMALQNCENWRSKLPDQAKAVTPCCVQLIKDAQRNVPSDQRADVLAQLSDYYAKIGTGAGMTWKEALHVLVKFYGDLEAAGGGGGADADGGRRRTRVRGGVAAVVVGVRVHSAHALAQF